MEQKIKFNLSTKIALFILLIWIYYFNNDSKVKKSLGEKHNVDIELNLRTYRLLAKYKQDKYSNIVELKNDISNNGESKKENISINDSGGKGLKKQSNRCILEKAQYYTEVMDYNNGMFDGKHFHFEKRMVKKRNYDDFLERKRRIYNIAFKKVKFRSYGFGITIFFFFFLLGIGLPILKGLESVEGLLVIKPIEKFCDLINEIPGLNDYSVLHIFLVLFSILIVSLGVIIIISIPKILKNNEKYKKMKLMIE
ncbi:fam-m protein [Plasmodium malariae]|uniref:Fam-m protein n=1 Tax=Plasmodium malariae TaxID=5858 RepID=A0A1D3JJ00_PLAMA|nr:fam-m protein [Plasmodium malariae]SBT86376.1 fam-m protein [Plasmodium malariae]